jgi:hypothetical protein
MPETSDGKIALLALIALSAWLLICLPMIYLQNESHKIAQSLWMPTDSVGLYTLVLAAFTAVLAIVSIFQGVLLLRADKTTRIAANAAMQSADAAFAAERARFFIVIEQHNLTNIIEHVERSGMLGGGENLWIRYHFQNYGKTPGIIKALSLNSIIAAEPADSPSHPVIVKDFLEYMIGTNSPTKQDSFGPITPPNLSQVQAIGRNSERFWFYGRLYYGDVFGNHQVHKFYFRSHRVSGGVCTLQPFDYKDYNKST